ncbi:MULTISPECIES: carbohydrate ABC transporter permease [Paenibacillus]|jgi:raffinose/stachyose/melibiose transport system permease protein|uniref:Carbohydrate ABC transporter membrane protein 1 (CUT1 family) n=2 Tax=Paenibacillus TaxID=44249 RepID=A0A855XYK5_9BACL|nr:MULTISPECIES: sugar ABC transporter permease [Paenibacillus]PWW33338.1 carbohydrate ABC transporter membrane protein 1 (CUT1 family) [Paenibacillus pabuli]PXW08419.1 carbohydrate ABC transporter membrane protein 1 (CUT1 family) [Paenibacillus taichungensis]QLG37907.1 sugar ABC transporter permease [Paenibacillus sp. E222]RAI99191.1 carbohydrate ABC transporter membrane protein 1 (CUT1 family) [Paenibacillus pabuli]RAW15986.1 sugar ABC transporter permease [Paenibacillus taichungensis]
MNKRIAPYYWMTVPAVVLFFVFMTLPALQGIYYSFTNYNGFGKGYDFVGFKNYFNLFQDDNVGNAYWFTFKFAIVVTILTNILSLLIALGLNAKIKFRNFFRGIYFLPNILSVLIVGYIFNYLFSNVFPIWGQNLGINALSTNILGSESLAWIGIVIVAVWQSVALNTILYLAGLQTIPTTLYEASNLDGAGKWREFWSITFPLIAPFFTINMVLAMKNSLMVFDQIVALTNGGPGRATQSISHLIYTGGFEGGEYAYQSANSVIYFIVIAVISILQIRFLQRRETDL